MRLLRVHVIAADPCGGLLDGLDLWLRSPFGHYETFAPLYLIGPNGTGKSQFLQVLAEIFQAVFHATVPEEERIEGNPSLQFEVEYLIRPHSSDSDIHVRIARLAEGRRRPALVIQTRADGEWVSCDLTDRTTLALLPPKVVGYTSGDNETLSLPFLLSRGGYADVVGRRALAQEVDETGVPDTRLLWIDYGTHLEVLVANLLLGANEQRIALLEDARLRDVHSFRCIMIYTAASNRVCPFCGCESFDAPGAPREDLDHYLSKSRYPFAVANLRNLVPMGKKCNESYKLGQNILRDIAGVRRRSFDPYAKRHMKVTLDNSVPFGGADGQTPARQIDFDPDSEECTTWDDVFHIRERIKRDVLDPSFRQWLGNFAAWFKKRRGIADPGDAEVLDAIRTYAEDLMLMGLTACEFLRAPVFQMLHRYCASGDQRVLALMKNVVTMAVP